LERAIGGDPCLHPFDESLRAQVNLIFQLKPRAGCVCTGSDELLVLSRRFLAICAERAEHPVGGQKGGRLRQARGRTITAPRPVLWLASHPGAHGIEHDVAGELKKIAVLKQ
jgi:hypothetical protein